MSGNYKVKIKDIQNKYKFKIFCASNYDDSEIKKMYEAIYMALPKEKASGTSITLNDTAKSFMKNELNAIDTSQSILPTGYTQVEYIESSGTQYIDLGYKYNANDNIEIKFVPLEANVDKALFGAYQGQDTGFCELGYYSNKLRGNISESGSPTYTTGTIYECTLINGKWNYNNSPFGAEKNITMTSNCYLFGANHNGATKLSSNRVYSLKMKRNNNVINNFIPCYRNSDNEIGLYDLVTNTFLTNAGTGTFTYGSVAPTLDAPIPINVVSGDNEVVVCGKNLLNLDRTLGTPSDTSASNSTPRTFDTSTYVVGMSSNNYYYPNNVSSYSVSNNAIKVTSTNNPYGLSMPMKLNKGTYTLSFNYSSGNISFVSLSIYDSNNLCNTFTNISSGGTFTIDNDNTNILLTFKSHNDVENTYSNIQLEKGTTATDYIKYQGSQEVTLTLGDKEICKTENYEDKIFKAIKGDEIYDSLSNEEKNTLDYGKWYLRKAVRHLSLAIADMNNSEDYPGWAGLTQLKEDYPSYGGALNTKTDYKCNIIIQSLGGINLNTQGTNAILWLGKAMFNNQTQTQWKTNYPNLVFELYYGLQKPTNELFNDIQQEQLEDIYNNMLSYEGQTNISQINNDLPFNINSSALKDLSDL